MTDTSTTIADAPQPGLLARIVGIIFSPRETYAAVAARPRSLGILAVLIAVMAGAQFAFLSTEVGQDIAFDQQISSMEAFGVNVTDEMYSRMEQGISRAKYTSAGSLVVFIPLANAILAGILMVIFTMLLGGSGTFKEVFAIVAHAGVISTLQQLFALPLTYASGQASGANLGVFVPMLEERSFAVLFLSSIDLFLLWWTVSLAMGLAVLYKRKTGPIATGLIGLYVVIALIIALIRS